MVTSCSLLCLYVHCGPAIEIGQVVSGAHQHGYDMGHNMTSIVTYNSFIIYVYIYIIDFVVHGI